MGCLELSASAVNYKCHVNVIEIMTFVYLAEYPTAGYVECMHVKVCLSKNSIKWKEEVEHVCIIISMLTEICFLITGKLAYFTSQPTRPICQWLFTIKAQRKFAELNAEMSGKATNLANIKKHETRLLNWLNLSTSISLYLTVDRQECWHPQTISAATYICQTGLDLHIHT